MSCFLFLYVLFVISAACEDSYFFMGFHFSSSLRRGRLTSRVMLLCSLCVMWSAKVCTTRLLCVQRTTVARKLRLRCWVNLLTCVSEGLRLYSLHFLTSTSCNACCIVSHVDREECCLINVSSLASAVIQRIAPNSTLALYGQ